MNKNTTNHPWKNWHTNWSNDHPYEAYLEREINKFEEHLRVVTDVDRFIQREGREVCYG